VAVLLAAAAGAAEAPAHWRLEWPRTDFSRSAVSFDEILSGGPPRDGIPAIDTPKFATVAAQKDRLAPNEPVLSLQIAGDARAYPLQVLIWHEIVNDTVGGVPVAITYCPLCNSGIAFRRVVGGAETTFGTTGKLRHSDLVMYDRATESWWQQYSGRAIVGKMTGAQLDRLPVRLESFADFAARHPEGRVLVPTGDVMRSYGANPYMGYDRAARPFLYRGRYDGPGRPLMRVVTVEGSKTAWSLELLRKKGRIEEGDLVLSWKPGQASALDQAVIAKGRDVGTALVQRRHADGTLEDVAYEVPFAFTFLAFTPDGIIRHTE